MAPIKQKLYQQVAAQIAADIKAGVYQPGQKLPPERDIAAKYNISRPTMREALTALEVIKLVQVRKGSGIFVTEDVPESTPSTDLKTSAFELIEARILFEGEAAAVAAVTVTPEDIVELEAILQEMEREIKAGPARGPADRQFHMKIAEATQNATIVHVVSMLWDIGQESIIYKHFQMAAAQAGFRVRLDEHEAILNALKQKDAQAARLAMREHLTRVMNNMLQATESEEIERARREIAEKRENVRKRIAM